MIEHGGVAAASEKIPSAVATSLARERAEHRSRLRNASRTRREGRKRDALCFGGASCIFSTPTETVFSSASGPNAMPFRHSEHGGVERVSF